jgi:PKD repeat protein
VIYYTEPGEYLVTLRVTNPCGTKEILHTITIEEKLEANFDYTPKEGVFPLNLQFTDTSRGSPTRWQWEVGEWHDITQNMAKSYNEPGEYEVTLTIWRETGEKSSITKTVKLALPEPTPTPTPTPTPIPTPTLTESPTPKPTKTPTPTPTPTETPTPRPTESPTPEPTLFPEFRADQSIGMAPLTVTFTDETAGGTPIEWVWRFGDGTSPVETDQAAIQHTFRSPGFYTISMDASNGQRFFSETKERYIDVGTPIEASFTHGKLEGQMPLEVWFTDTSKGSVDTWEWDFGPYGTQTTKNPWVIYNTSGQYPVTLTVSNQKYGRSDVTSATIHVIEHNDFVQASFIADQTVGKAPLAVQFLDTSLGYPDEWDWDFGDLSQSSYVQNPLHFFEEPGAYRVILTVTNSVTKVKDQAAAYIKVTADGLSEVAFEPEEYVGPAPLRISFKDKTDLVFEPTSWLWNFGDGSNSFEQNPIHTYEKPGMYTVALEAKNKEGVSQKSRVVYITVTAPSKK